MHIAGLLFFPVAIILWEIAKDKDSRADIHGKHIFNWLLSLLIYVVAGYFILRLGSIVIITVGVCSVIFSILAAVKAWKGETWKYPCSITIFRTNIADNAANEPDVNNLFQKLFLFVKNNLEQIQKGNKNTMSNGQSPTSPSSTVTPPIPQEVSVQPSAIINPYTISNQESPDSQNMVEKPNDFSITSYQEPQNQQTNMPNSPSDENVSPILPISESPEPQETSTPPPNVTNPWAALDQEIQEQQTTIPVSVPHSPSQNEQTILQAEPAPGFSSVVQKTFWDCSPSGRLLVVSEPTVYIPKNRASVWLNFFTVLFDNNTAIGGFFNVDGKPCELQTSSDDEKGVGNEIIGDTALIRSYFRKHGAFRITFSVGGESVVRQVRVVGLPIEFPQILLTNDFIPPASQEVIKALGFPDEESSLQVKFPHEITKDRIRYQPEFAKDTIFAKHWRYNKYPGLVISIVDEKVYAVSVCTPELEQQIEQFPALWIKHDDKGAGPGSGCAGLILLGVIGLLSSGIGCCCLLVSLLF
jgi:uncharacterized Tic20 family protein